MAFTVRQPGFRLLGAPITGGDGSEESSELPNCLEFSGEDGCHVTHGWMWPHGYSERPGGYGACFWEALVKPSGTFTGYVISDGYGGAHAVLFGMNGGPTVGYNITGNQYTGATTASYTGLDSSAENQWTLIGLAFDGAKIRTFRDGLCDGEVAANNRTNLGISSGCGLMFVGGSDHSHFKGRVARIVGWDDDLAPFVSRRAYRPQRRTPLWTDAENGGLPPQAPVQFLADYSHVSASGFVPDLSAGCRGQLHPGYAARESSALAILPGIWGGAAPEYQPPTPVYDSTLALYLGDTDPGIIDMGEVSRTPRATPSGAIVWDSFQRANRTFFNGATTTLGTTEGGSLGPLTYTYATHGSSISASGTFGILNGRGVCVQAAGRPFALVNAGTDNVTVEGVRTSNIASGMQIVLAWRANPSGTTFAGWVAHFQNGGYRFIRVQYITGGTVTQDFFVDVQALADSWTRLTITHTGTTITIRCDGATVGTLTGRSEGAGNTRIGWGAGDESGTVDSTLRMVEFAAFAA